jgi:murein DD-endopeptidase MepM/ murein hydrolase activator NlpD
LVKRSRPEGETIRAAKPARRPRPAEGSSRPALPRGALLCLLAVAVLAPWGAFSPAAAEEGDGHAHGEYIEVLEEEARLRDAADAAQARADELALQVLDLDGRVAAVQAELADMEIRLGAAQVAASEAEAELRRTEERLTAEQLRLRRQAVDAYIGGGVDSTPDIMGALRDPDLLDDVASSRVYAEVVIADRKEIIARIGDLKETATRLEVAARASRDEARQLRDEVAARAADLETQLADRAAAQAAAEVAVQEQQLAAFAVELRRREYEFRYAEISIQSDSIAEMLKARQKDQTPPLFTFGIFTMPVEGGTLGSSYGPRLHPILGITRMHAGIDISAPVGTPMVASGGGEVVLAEDRGGYGLTVVIDHGNQLATLYAHMDSLAVKPGDIVEQGEVVGTVGSTGLSTGPHVHWEVRVLGLPVDGTPYVRVERP